MSDIFDSGSLDAGNAIRLAGAMRERAEAQRAADAAREALEAAELRLEGAGRQVDELKAGVTFEDLLDLVASLSLRVAELESGGSRVAPAEPAVAEPSVADGAHSGSRDGESEWSRANPVSDSGASSGGLAPSERASPASEPPPAEPPSRAGADGDDPFADSDSYEGRRAPNRPVLYMNAYARGYAEARAGEPESISGTRGWEFKGYRDGRKHAAAALGFDPLGAFVEEMRACRTPIEPKVRDQARKLSQILANDHGRRLQEGVPAAAPHPVAGPAMAEERLDGEEDSDEAVQIPGFLRRPASEATAG